MFSQEGTKVLLDYSTMVQHTGGEKQRRDLISLLKTAINHLIANCYFNVENVTTKQEFGISMGIEPAPFWENLFYIPMKKNKTFSQ